MDKKIFLKLYGYTEKYQWLKNISIIITKASYYVFFVIYGIGGIYLISGFDKRLIRYILIPLWTLIINTAIRKLLKKPRPFDELEIESSIGHKMSYSFPSNHAASAMVISIAIMYIDMKIGIAIIPLAILTGMSRILTGVHYPKDVLVGWINGIVLGVIGLLIY